MECYCDAVLFAGLYQKLFLLLQENPEIRSLAFYLKWRAAHAEEKSEYELGLKVTGSISGE